MALRNIWVAYEHGALGRRALRLAGEVARSSGAELTLAQNAPALDDPPDALALELLRLTEQDRERRRLERAAAELAPGVAVRTRLTSGPPTQALLDMLRWERPDLVVAATRRSPGERCSRAWSSPARGSGRGSSGCSSRLQERWRDGPIGAPPRPRRQLRGTSPIFTMRPSGPDVIVGDLGTPERVLGRSVVAHLRVRRDRAGALVALEDGRYAITGPLLVAGSRDDLTTYARRRAKGVEPDRAWLQSVVGALAIDVFDAAPAQPRATHPGGQSEAVTDAAASASASRSAAVAGGSGGSP